MMNHKKQQQQKQFQERLRRRHVGSWQFRISEDIDRWRFETAIDHDLQVIVANVFCPIVYRKAKKNGNCRIFDSAVNPSAITYSL